MNIWFYRLSDDESRQFRRVLSPLIRQGFLLRDLKDMQAAEALLARIHMREFPDLLISGMQGTPEVFPLLENLRLQQPVDFLPVLKSPAAYDLASTLQYGPVDVLAVSSANRRISDRRILQAFRRFLSLRAGLDALPDYPNQADIDLLLDRHFPLSGAIPSEDPFQIPSSQPRASSGPEDTLQPLMDRLSDMFMLSRAQLGGIIASDAARRLQISRVSARAYLEMLWQEGYVKKETRPNAQPGRPAIFYIPIREFFL